MDKVHSKGKPILNQSVGDVGWKPLLWRPGDSDKCARVSLRYSELTFIWGEHWVPGLQRNWNYQSFKLWVNLAAAPTQPADQVTMDCLQLIEIPCLSRRSSLSFSRPHIRNTSLPQSPLCWEETPRANEDVYTDDSSQRFSALKGYSSEYSITQSHAAREAKTTHTILSGWTHTQCAEEHVLSMGC